MELTQIIKVVKYQTILSTFIAVLMAFTITFPSSAVMASDDETTLFLNITSDDAWTADMALSYAGHALKMGYPVVVFLNVRGVRLADKNATQEPGDAGKTPKEMLAKLMEDGATVYVCGMCTKKAGMTEADWIDGVKLGSPETIKIQMAEDTKVMSY